MKTNVVSGNCPECNSTILFKKTPYVGQSTYCDNCNSELEVSQIDPLELEWAVGPGFMESNEQRFTKRRSRSKPSEELILNDLERKSHANGVWQRMMNGRTNGKAKRSAHVSNALFVKNGQTLNGQTLNS